MTHPPAPWTLQGYAIQSAHLLDIERVRPYIPQEFGIIQVLPGKTVGGVYLSHYGSGSVLEYSELIVVAGLVSYSGKFGGWISHIYVDNPDSVAGGREIWGLPKELAEFTWKKGDRIQPQSTNRFADGYDSEARHSRSSPTASQELLGRSSASHENRIIVQQGNQLLCSLDYGQQSFGWRIPLGGYVFSTLNSSILLFKGGVESRFGLVSSQLTVPVDSPFRNLQLGQPWLTVYAQQLHLNVSTPEVVGHRQSVFSYQ